jgi:hypothetical protein
VARTKKDRSTPPAGELAQNSQETASKGRGRGFGRPFVPGQSGNPGGRRKDVLGIQRLALELCPEALEKLAKLMREAESDRAQASAAIAILDRGCGKPSQPVDGQHNVIYHVRDEPMSLDEWRRTFTDE